VYTNRYITTFCMIILSPSAAMKVEALWSLQTLVSTSKSTQRCNPEDQHWHIHRWEHL
jgi:hypothetical protein